MTSAYTQQPKMPPVTHSRQGHVPIRTVRVPDDIWKAAKTRASEQGETVTDVLIRALRTYNTGKESSE
jgi:NRPS condensation-like uncharacterized protein